MPTSKNTKKAVIFALLSAASMSVMALFVKLAAPHINNTMIVFVRYAISLLYIIAIIVIHNFRNKPFQYKTKHIGLHFFRSIVTVLTLALFYYSLGYVSLVDVNLLVMTRTLFIPIIMFIVFRKKTLFPHWFAIVIGFVGITFVLKPDVSIFNPASLIALSAGFCGAIAIMSIRALNKYDSPHTSMLYYFSIGFLITAIIAIFNWQTPDLHTFILLICVSIFGTSYQEFLIRATQYASSKIVSSLLYTSIVFSGFSGMIIWAEIPGLITTTGIILVCIGSLLTIKFANKQKALRKDKNSSGA